jgi:hypothetical protein
MYAYNLDACRLCTLLSFPFSFSLVLCDEQAVAMIEMKPKREENSFASFFISTSEVS